MGFVSTKTFFESLLYVIVGFTVNFLQNYVNYIHVVYAQIYGELLM
jgi:hypothetical protein